MPYYNALVLKLIKVFRNIYTNVNCWYLGSTVHKIARENTLYMYLQGQLNARKLQLTPSSHFQSFVLYSIQTCIFVSFGKHFLCFNVKAGCEELRLAQVNVFFSCKAN